MVEAIGILVIGGLSVDGLSEKRILEEVVEVVFEELSYI